MADIIRCWLCLKHMVDIFTIQEDQFTITFFSRKLEARNVFQLEVTQQPI